MLQRARFFDNGETILDVGCGPGYLAEYLTKQKNCLVVGVEQDPRLAEIARRVCAQVHEVDLETEGLRNIQGKFTAIFFGDVIEHVRNAPDLLRQASELLEVGGRVIVSTPNFVHIKNRVRVLFGSFEYRDAGLLDRTHVHFYTKRTLYGLLNEAGYRVVRTDFTTGVMNLSSLRNRALHILARAHPNLFAYQFIVAAVRR
ncbi:MAG: class I SAM-dependent methyltransferase [Burkholderiales bacterium]